ncbi:hybrid sensor histidine kinase/response regulator [Paraliomyxa miuraensis]|uniref:hybrid sensor histidine kinase/response regulator n=1 Tax=Paraliomyxa miuraensis TaxID=376150 RepID=UPI00225AF82B|nr:ATP-binding protein [Paraliomyxa miuraensis]MCX4246467.1 ATP-binding protein [Paraliomyxa miuraensis]
MKEPEIPDDEAQRLEALAAYHVLDTEPEQAYDDLVKVVSHLLHMPIALVSLVDAQRQWFKARVGLEPQQTSRAVSFCAHAVAQRRSLVIENALEDQRFRDNPLVTGPPHIRFYAGAPLQSPEGHVLGTLCAIDREPRTMSPEQLELLEALARQAVSLLELRRRAAEAERTEAKLREVTKIQRRFWELSLDMLAVSNYEGNFTRLNPAWTKVLGWSVEELTTQPFLDFLHPDDVERTLAEASRLYTGTYETVTFENRYRCKDGSYRWLLWSSTPDPETRMLMGVARDITFKKELEQTLREARQAAEDANQAKSDFLANMSHELRTPLNSVIGFTNILLKNKHGALGARELDYLRRINTNGHHLLRLINDVLDLSKIEAGRIDVRAEEADLGKLAQDVVDQLQGQAQPARTRLRVTVPQGLRALRGDRDRLEQVLINLVGNAIKFTAGGTVEVRIHADAEGRPLRLDVIDDGLGIPADKHAVIFESFRQADESTRRRFGGTGLGLAISRSLCEMMGLRLELASEEGRGSSFAISFVDHELPLVYEPPSSSSAGEMDFGPEEPGPSVGDSRPGPSPREPATVLVIDDDADARAVLESFLQDYGCQIVAADSGERGIELARKLRPDLITLDLMMPRMDGWSVLAAMHEDPELRDIPVVVCSIVGGESRGSLVGASAVMDKPIDREELYEVLRAHLDDPSRSADIEDLFERVLGSRRTR